jgi:hypothetical protein
VIDFKAWMGVTGNALDYSYEARSNIPDFLDQFAGYCAAAAEIDSKYCQLASASMKSSDPTSDIVNRINNILNVLATRPAFSASDGALFAYFELASTTGTSWSPGDWHSTVNMLVDIENTIQARHKRDTSSSANLSYAAFHDYFAKDNPFTSFVLGCIDNSYTDINDDTSFIDYLSSQIARNSLIAYQGIDFGSCIGWPNLASHNLEKFTGPFPASISNKILIVAESYSVGYSYNSILNTYEFVGADNAVLLIHDAFGRTLGDDPNNCTLNTVQAYLINGYKPHFI